MNRTLALSLSAAVATLAVVDDAAACVPLRFDMSRITAASMARDMTDDATTIEVMRAVSRIRVPALSIYANAYGPLYEYRLETIETLKGRSSGVMSFTAPDVDWLGRQLPGSRRHFELEPLWWLTPRGYERLQRTSIFLPHDFASTTCAAPVVFEIGAEYLIFREENGRLLRPGFNGDLSRPGQRPALEQVEGANDPWLIAVREAIAHTPAGVSNR